MISSKQVNKTGKNTKSIENGNIIINEEENEIKFIKRTIENNTHEVIEDTKIKKITSWRKSKEKFFHNLIYNILSFGILHIISLFYPKLYLKLYCNPWIPKECDFFLVENIYGEVTLCTKNYKKRKNIGLNYDSQFSNENKIYSNNKTQYYLIKEVVYSFKYKSVKYEYNEESDVIIPVYMDLSKMTNKEIFNYFGDGLSSDILINSYKEKYGNNEYDIDIDLVHMFFKKTEIKYFIFILLTKLFDLFTSDYFSLVETVILIIIILFIEYYVTKKIIYNIYAKEKTLDGEENKLKVRRNTKLLNDSYFYYEIKNCDLLPGDIIYLKSNDLVPCDCLILEGECIVNESDLTGNFNIFKKIPLDNNNEQFNYKFNMINILFHGMKVIKTHSNLKDGYISVLCINIGPNTFKANQYSNIMHLFERKVQYKEMFNLLGENRKWTVIFMVIIFIFSILLGIFYMFNVNKIIDYEIIKQLIIKTLAKLLSKSSMPVYFFTKSLILIRSVFNLKNEKIFCFEKSKILNSCTINTIIFGKAGILCENNLKINCYHPAYLNLNKSNKISYRNYNVNQNKEMNSQLLNYYKDYINKKQNININNNSNNIYDSKIDNNNNQSCKYTTLFLECLLCCNNLEKYNIEIFGNPIEKEIFLNMKWDIKTYNYNNNLNKIILDDEFSYENKIHNFYSIDNKSNFIVNNINDIYPNNYYKITESFKNEKEVDNSIISKLNSNYNLTQSINNSQFDNIKSYKLRVFKRFIKSGTLNSSAIVYNFITKDLKFMTKGMPEEILDKCDVNTLPDNFNRTISLFRKSGFIPIICASKIINKDEYKDTNTIDDYMNNLTFCGFITLKNKLKKEVILSIKDLRQFNCNLIISTGDNIYNTLSVGFDSQIIENKNVFSFDKEEKIGLTITKIYSIKHINDEENKSTKISFDKYSKLSKISKLSKNTSKISNKVITSQNHTEREKENGDFKKSLIIQNTNININKNINNSDSIDYQFFRDSNNKKEMHKYFSTKVIKNQKKSRNIIDIKNKPFHLDISNLKNNHKNEETKLDFMENSFRVPLNSSYRYREKNTDTTNKKKKINNSNDLLKSSINKNYNNNLSKSYIEKYNYYLGIFEEHAELIDNCIYCVSGKAFSFLYKNKEKKQCKKILEKIYKNCKIFYDMSSLDKSLVIDFYREFPDNYVCELAETQSDYDAIITSNVGINIKAPKNRNTMLCHFYSDLNILSIKKIIREGRAVNENLILLKISSIFYTMTLNSYIICCFIRQVNILNQQLNFLEVCFLIMSVSAFIVRYDHFATSNPLIQNKKLYICHYAIQIIGIFLIKFISIYVQCIFFIGNRIIDEKQIDIIYCSYYFIFCIEQLISTIFLFNLISFYRKNPFSNYFFIIFTLILSLYFLLLELLNSSNYKYDIFNITFYEFVDDLADSFADQNKLKSFLYCLIDLFGSIIYSRIIYYIFDFLAHRNIK